MTEPRKNEYFERLRLEKNLRIVKMKSSNNYTIALMSDGNIYGWGSNESGQMGIKTEIGVEIYETANFPTPIVNEDFIGKKIVDLDIGEDIMVILLETNEVFWCGIKMAYKPELLRLPSDIGKIKSVGACYRCCAVVTEDNQIYMKNAFVQHDDENINTGIRKVGNHIFGGGNILDIGGNYRNRFAIVD